MNKFKHLSHLTLRCRPGNDPAVKHYLACRLWDVKANRATLAESLQQTRARLEEAEAAGQRQAAELAEHRERSAASAGEMRNEQVRAGVRVQGRAGRGMGCRSATRRGDELATLLCRRQMEILFG